MTTSQTIISVTREVTISTSTQQDWTEFRRSITPQIEKMRSELYAEMQRKYMEGRASQ